MVAVFRIRVGREIESAALVADGYHARTDGLTSLAVVVGAAGVWLGFPLADPIIGMLITLTIFAIVWQSSKAVLERMLDGVDPAMTAEIRHAAERIPEILDVVDVKARWLGHRLTAELDIGVSKSASLVEADQSARRLEHEIREHNPALSSVRIRARPEGALLASESKTAAPHHAPNPVRIEGRIASGSLEIVDTPAGERMRFTADSVASGLQVSVSIRREGRDEALTLRPMPGHTTQFISDRAPEEPHEFDATLRMRLGDAEEVCPFAMREAPGYSHAH